MSDKKLAQVFHYDIFGKREEKYTFLSNVSFYGISWKLLEIDTPNYFYLKKNVGFYETYRNYCRIVDIFKYYNAGLATEFDEFSIKNSSFDAGELKNKLLTFNAEEIIRFYNLGTKKIDKVKRAINDIRKNKSEVTPITYRPFDTKFTLYTGLSNGFMGRPRDGIMKHLMIDNIAILTCRQQRTSYFRHVYISKYISERCSVSLQTGVVNYVFPLYFYAEDKNIELIAIKENNIKESYINEVSKRLNLMYESELKATHNSFTSIELFDYI